jgi:hypothetical protein
MGWIAVASDFAVRGPIRNELELAERKHLSACSLYACHTSVTRARRCPRWQRSESVSALSPCHCGNLPVRLGVTAKRCVSNGNPVACARMSRYPPRAVSTAPRTYIRCIRPSEPARHQGGVRCHRSRNSCSACVFDSSGASGFRSRRADFGLKDPAPFGLGNESISAAATCVSPDALSVAGLDTSTYKVESRMKHC